MENMTYKKEYLETFLMHQTQLFDEPVAETIEEADEFLDDCMAVVADSLRDVRDYFEAKRNGHSRSYERGTFGAGGDICTSGWKVSDRRGLGERWKI